jgi:hypothetical protein
VHLNPCIVLDDVLYLPEFKYNLLSIHKLVSQLSLRLIFENNSCMIQDLPSQKMIGSVSADHGLYLLKVAAPSGSFISTVQSSVTTDFSISDPVLWHYRLGHLSLTRVHSLMKDYPFISINKNLVCDACHSSRQRRLPFSLSCSRATAPFDMIHADIWGPFSQSSIY